MSDDVDEAGWPRIPYGYEPLDWHRGFGRQVGPLYRRTQGAGIAGTMAFRVQEHHANGMNNAHGGMLMTLADIGWGHVVSVERSSFWVTIRLTCDFLSAARVGDWVQAGGEVLSIDGDLFSVRGRIWAGDRTLMTGVGLFKSLSPREPRPGEKAFREAAGRETEGAAA